MDVAKYSCPIHALISLIAVINTQMPRRNEQHFADDIFKRIFFNDNVWIFIKISLKFVPKGPISIIPALVRIMAWRRSGDKPLSEPMRVSLRTHICVTRPQWVNDAQTWKKITWFTLITPGMKKKSLVFLQNSLLFLRMHVWHLCIVYQSYINMSQELTYFRVCATQDHNYAEGVFSMHLDLYRSKRLGVHLLCLGWMNYNGWFFLDVLIRTTCNRNI